MLSRFNLTNFDDAKILRSFLAVKLARVKSSTELLNIEFYF